MAVPLRAPRHRDPEVAELGVPEVKLEFADRLGRQRDVGQLAEQQIAQCGISEITQGP